MEAHAAALAASQPCGPAQAPSASTGAADAGGPQRDVHDYAAEKGKAIPSIAATRGGGLALPEGVTDPKPLWKASN